MMELAVTWIEHIFLPLVGLLLHKSLSVDLNSRGVQYVEHIDC